MQKIYSITVSNVQKGILLDLVQEQLKVWNTLDDSQKNNLLGSKLKAKIYDNQLRSLKKKLTDSKIVGVTIL